MRHSILFLLTCICFGAIAQKAQKINLERADELEGGRYNNEEIRKLRGNVIFSQDNTKLFCDSAYQYVSRNAIEAFGKVRIEEGDSVTITGKRLIYDGDTKIAQMSENVVMKDKTMTLTTNNLDYNVRTQTGYYYSGGKIINGRNTLTSVRGNYHAPSKMFYFKKDVHLKNPDYEIWCDTLQYSTASEIAYFKGPTKIKTKDGYLNAKKGKYNTITGESFFEDQASIENEEYILRGDSLNYNEKNKIGFAHGNINLYLKESKITVCGNTGYYNEKMGISRVFGGHPYMKTLMDEDTLFLHADTLIAVTDSSRKLQQLFAYHQVKIFKSDLQGACDSLYYDLKDSIMYFYKEPVLWSENNQITGVHIKAFLKNNTIDKMYVNEDAFVVSEDSFANYNQVKGKNMIAYFEQGKIKKLNVKGNGQSTYFVIDDGDKFTGLNKTLCSNMIFYFDSSQVSRIKFLVEPTANFIPPKELTEDDKILPGFLWRKNERPDLEAVIGRKRLVINN